MKPSSLRPKLDRLGDVIPLVPQIVGRFYGDGNRLGQRKPGARTPAYYKPERWIGSSTGATNPPGIPEGGVSVCRRLGPAGEPLALRDLLADPELGPRLLGEKRFAQHGGVFRVLIKLLDARLPIPFHVHADDEFVSAHRGVYPRESFGKDEAYHFLDAPKGDCSYTHVGLYPGVTARQLVAAMRRGTDHVMDLSPGTLQRYGEGNMVKAGLLHRPGTAVTLEIQQPSDVYTFFQTDFGGKPLAEEVLYPGFKSIEEAAEAVVNWQENLNPNLLASTALKPTPFGGATSGATSGGASGGASGGGGIVEWVYPPTASRKFSGVRITVQSEVTLKFDDPCVLFVWRGQGKIDGQAVDGGGGPVGKADEFFIGQAAAKRGLTLTNTGDGPVTAFALFAAALG
ncbi:MAG: hypothetical protein IT443_06665 [Phycisphaeraceae bacterium]|nr:hypothetical protein [Phycisphaeraceae bacterium]